MTLALMAQINPTGGRRRRVAVEGLPQVGSRFVPLELGASPISGRFEPAVAEQRKTVTITCEIEPGQTLPGEMVATLEGLPPRAVAASGHDLPRCPARRIPGRSRAPRTPAGRYESLACRLSGNVGGQPVVYRVGRGGRLEIHPAGALVAGGDGKPLSPLDALRLREAAAAKDTPARRGDR